MSFDFTSILAKAGLNIQSLEKIRLAPGVVGKTTLAVIAAIFAIAFLASGITNEYLLMVVIIIIAGLVIWHSVKTRTFAKENPQLALLEGAEFVAYKQIELAEKEQSHPAGEIPVPNPAPSKESLIQLTEEQK